jgi:AraC family transcriptional activator of pobA
MKKPPIILHKDELDHLGLETKKIEDVIKMQQIPHRDDHYMFVIQSEGNFQWELDFENVTMDGSSLFFVAPGQVHRYLNFDKCKGWFVFVDTRLISNRYREIFDTYLHTRQVIFIEQSNPVFVLVPVLNDLLAQKEVPLLIHMVTSLTDTITGIIASGVMTSQKSLNSIGSQKFNITLKYKQLIKENYRNFKQVYQYASLLNITPLYLNEIIKSITGFPASYWIHQEIIVEAKRLLYYSNLDIKEIAADLGYEDHTYFSRFFKNKTGITASAFQNQYKH